jgi:hypothetical protein
MAGPANEAGGRRTVYTYVTLRETRDSTRVDSFRCEVCRLLPFVIPVHKIFLRLVTTKAGAFLFAFPNCGSLPIHDQEFPVMGGWIESRLSLYHYCQQLGRFAIRLRKFFAHDDRPGSKAQTRCCVHIFERDVVGVNDPKSVAFAGPFRIIRHAGTRKDESGYAVSANDSWPVNYGLNKGNASTGNR